MKLLKDFLRFFFAHFARHDSSCVLFFQNFSLNHFLLHEHFLRDLSLEINLVLIVCLKSPTLNLFVSQFKLLLFYFPLFLLNRRSFGMIWTRRWHSCRVKHQVNFLNFELFVSNWIRFLAGSCCAGILNNLRLECTLYASSHFLFFFNLLFLFLDFLVHYLRVLI